MSFHIVILSYNHPQITSKCVQSALNLVPADRITLVHNGSREEFVSLLKAKFPTIEHVPLSQNLGFAGGANRGLKSGFLRSPWVFFVTNDCEVLRVAEPPPLPGLFAAKVFLRKIDRIDSTHAQFEPATGQLRHLKSGLAYQGSLKKNTLPYAPGTGFIIHQTTFSRVGEFDERLFTYWEDVDFGARAAEKGILAQAIDGFELLHRGGKTCHKDPFYTNYLFHRNRRIVSRRYCPWAHRPRLEAIMIRDWIRRSLFLLQQRRWRDLGQFFQAYF